MTYQQNQFPFNPSVEPTPGAPLVFSTEFRSGIGNWDPASAYNPRFPLPTANAIPGYQYVPEPARLWDPGAIWAPGGQVFIDAVRQAGCIIQPYPSEEGSDIYRWGGMTWRLPVPPTVNGEDEYSYLLYTRIGRMMAWQPDSSISGAYGIIVSLADLAGATDGAFVQLGFRGPEGDASRLCISKWSDSVTMENETAFEAPLRTAQLCLQIDIAQSADAESAIAITPWVCDEPGLGKYLLSAQELITSETPFSAITIGFAATGYQDEEHTARTSESAYCEYIRLEGPYDEEQMDTNPIDNPRCPLLRTTGGRNWPGG